VFLWFEKIYCNNCSFGDKKKGKLNAYFRVLEDIPRTTNSLEGYNRHINSLILSKKADD
jgi:hypothetical protein